MTNVVFLLGCLQMFGSCSRYKPRWPRPRRSFCRVRAHARSTIDVAMLPLASTRTRQKSSAIIAALGAICGPELHPRSGIVNPAASLRHRHGLGSELRARSEGSIFDDRTCELEFKDRRPVSGSSQPATPVRSDGRHGFGELRSPKFPTR